MLRDGLKNVIFFLLFVLSVNFVVLCVHEWNAFLLFLFAFVIYWLHYCSHYLSVPLLRTLSFLWVLVMHVGCDSYTSYFYLFKVFCPGLSSFILTCCSLSLFFFFFFFWLTKLNWPKLTCKVEKVVLLHYLFLWKLLLCNFWCLLLVAVTPLKQDQNGKPQHLWRGILDWRRIWQTMELVVLTWGVWL